MTMQQSLQRPYIVGNWKMHGIQEDINEARAISDSAAALNQNTVAPVDVALCIPATLIAQYAHALDELVIGAQDCHSETAGAFTGSISANMVRDAGARLTLLGHSERRDGCGETNSDVRKKVSAAISAGLGVILCFGESAETRATGQAVDFVLHQIAESLPDVGQTVLKNSGLTLAYEPIWAIGTGIVPTIQDVADMHCAIRAALLERFGTAGARIRILYGGSVHGGNATELLSIANVNGALVGGASLNAAKFVPILQAAAALANTRQSA